MKCLAILTSLYFFLSTAVAQDKAPEKGKSPKGKKATSAAQEDEGSGEEGKTEMPSPAEENGGEETKSEKGKAGEPADDEAAESEGNSQSPATEGTADKTKKAAADEAGKQKGIKPQQGDAHHTMHILIYDPLKPRVKPKLSLRTEQEKASFAAPNMIDQRQSSAVNVPEKDDKANEEVNDGDSAGSEEPEDEADEEKEGKVEPESRGGSNDEAKDRANVKPEEKEKPEANAAE